MIPVLAEVLGDRDEAIADGAIASLGRLGSRSVVVLQRHIDSGPVSERIRAVKALEKIGRGAKPAINQLVLLIGNSDTGLATAARNALKAIGPESIPAALNVLENSNAAMRKSVAELIIGTAPRSDDAARAMIRLAVTDDDKTVRDLASKAFRSVRKALISEQTSKQKTGTKSEKPVVDALLFAEFGSSDTSRRMFSFDSVAIIAAGNDWSGHGESIRAELAKHLDDPDQAIRGRVAEVLLSLGGFAELAKHVDFGCGFLLGQLSKLNPRDGESATASLRVYFKERHKRLIPIV